MIKGNKTNLLVKIGEQIIDKCNITQIRIFNVVIFYLALCVLLIMVLTLILLMIRGIEKIINRAEILIFGKEHQKSLEYKIITLLLMKCEVDIQYFLDWIKFDILKTRYRNIYIEDNTKMKWVRIFSFENLIIFVHNIINFFFKLSIVHLMLGIISMYVYFGKDILLVYERLKNVIIHSEVTPGQFVELFEVLTVIFLMGYIVLDIRHKASGFSQLRAERFKELVQMEEKLLNIIVEISYSLGKNIEVIVNGKCFILQNGASELSNKNCHIEKTKIKFIEKDRINFGHTDAWMRQFINLNDMKEEFQKLSELEKEYNNSALSYSNIYLIDHQAMLTRVVHLWIPGFGDKEYKKMEFFCKSSMEEWYKNRFVKPVENDNGKKNYYSEEQTTKKVLNASAMLDFELMRAFMLDLYLKKYRRKMTKRFKRINKFARLNLN